MNQGQHRSVVVFVSWIMRRMRPLHRHVRAVLVSIVSLLVCAQFRGYRVFALGCCYPCDCDWGAA